MLPASASSVVGVAKAVTLSTGAVGSWDRGARPPRREAALLYCSTGEQDPQGAIVYLYTSVQTELTVICAMEKKTSSGGRVLVSMPLESSSFVFDLAPKYY
jgi:hypothetical protein